MSEFELFEASSLVFNSMLDAAMNFVTVFFAYVVAAHLAGAKLPRYVAVGASVVYSLFLVGPFMGTIGSYTVYLKAAAEYAKVYPESWAVSTVLMEEWTAISLAALPLISGWVGSLYYMHFWIRGQTEDDA